MLACDELFSDSPCTLPGASDGACSFAGRYALWLFRRAISELLEFYGSCCSVILLLCMYDVFLSVAELSPIAEFGRTNER